MLEYMMMSCAAFVNCLIEKRVKVKKVKDLLIQLSYGEE